MDKRQLGGSQLAVAPLCFGGNVFGWTADEKTSFALLDAFVDLPFALPTAVAGIALSTLYAPKGWIGGMFSANGWLLIWSGAQPSLTLCLI